MKRDNKKEIQTTFNINSDNYEMYKYLHSIKGHYFTSNNPERAIVPTIVGVLTTILSMAVVGGLVSYGLINGIGSGLMVLFGIGATMGTFAVSLPLLLKIAEVIELELFKKKYPGINTNVDTYELGLKLEKFENRSLSNDYDYENEENNIIFDKTEEIISSGDSLGKGPMSETNLKQLSIDDEVEYYRNQKKFWEQVSAQEKNGNVVSSLCKKPKVK